MSDEAAQIERDVKNDRAVNRTVGGVQTGKGKKSNAPTKRTAKKGTQQKRDRDRCQKHRKDKWSAGIVRQGIYFGHMDEDEFKSKSSKVGDGQEEGDVAF